MPLLTTIGVYGFTDEAFVSVERLPGDAASALLCVERDPEACHRSLIAERLAAEHGLPVEHLRPA